jgi:hypothetical protein
MVASPAKAAPQSEPKPAATAYSLQEQLHRPWPRHHVCRDFLIANSLNAADVDGDGAPDFITVEGDDFRKGLPAGVQIFWSPGKARAREAAARQDADRVAGPENAQYLCSNDEHP